MNRRVGAALALAACAAGCGPALEWREVRPPGLHLSFELPCRPDRAARRLALGGAEVEMQLYACRAGGATYALGAAELDDPSRVGAALAELASAAQTNIAGRVVHDEAARVAGMTPHPGARRRRLAGTLPGGDAVAEEVAVFAYGSRVFQATVVGVEPGAEGVQAFFDALRVAP